MKKDFFISYNKHDKQWAEWIAWQLEAAGYQILIQLWDWGPGNNFILEMQKATELCERTIFVLSPHFLGASFTQPEWAQAFAQDSTGEKRLLIPVRVASCELKGLFIPLVYIDFLEVPPSDKHERREYLITKLLDGVNLNRKKPFSEPPLPDMEPTPVTTDVAMGTVGFVDDKAASGEKWQQSDLDILTPPNSKLHGKQRSELLNSLATDWLPNGPPVAILQGFPGCGKTQLASAIAANAPLSLDPIEPSPDAQDPSLDILMGLAGALASEGITDLMDEFEKGADGDLFNALLKVLRRERILIIIDEFQRLFAHRDALPPVGWQHLIEKLNNSSRPTGRLLLISNRAIKKMRWSEKCDIKELNGLTDSEAAAFLTDLLKSKNLTSKVPTERLEEICHRLGGNPRALTTLVESLAYDSLEELLSLAPDIFNTGDVEIINHALIEDFECELIERTLSRMESDLLKFMRWIAVHRRPFKKEAFSEFPNADVPMQVLRKQLIDRFLLESRPSGDTMHPLAREISVTRLRDEGAEWKQAHNLAANYHFRHFKAIQVKGVERCITSYAELRHHLFEAGRISELYLASDRLAQFALSQISKTTYSQIPTNIETLEERIALISALPEDRRPKGLEYHLALCLKHRNTGDDYQRALFHVRRAVGPNVYYAIWLLFIELEYSLNGVDAMLKAHDEALKYLGSGSNAFAVYHLCANLLSKDNRLDAAINMLEKGISTPGVACLSTLIAKCSSYMEKTGRYDDAIRVLRKCIDTPNTPELWKVYVQCVKLMAKMDRSGEAVTLLKRGLTVPGMTSLHHLYLLLARRLPLFE